jgi:hypothetical protein
MLPQYWQIIALLIAMFLSACSGVNSVQTFDQQQADLLLQQMGKTRPSQQMLVITLPDSTDWKKTNYAQNEVGSFILLVPQQENNAHWDESIQARLLSMIDEPTATAEKIVQATFNEASKNCALVTAKILQENKLFIIYQLNKSQCTKEKATRETGKIFNGIDGVYSIRYIIDNKTISAHRLKQMSARIEAAKLVKRSWLKDR